MFDRRQADSFGGFILEHEQMAELSQVCLICGTQPFRYRCPRCQAKLCGLACVKQHKKEWDCDGHRAKTDFVPLRQFDNLTLLNDVRLLESATQVKGNCQRDSLLRLAGDDQQRSKEIRFLRTECDRRQIQLEFLPVGLQKHQKNTSVFNPIAETIFWCIEWRFVEASNFTFNQERIPESVTIGTLINRLISPHRGNEISPEMTEKLKLYRSCRDIFCFMKVERNEWTRETRYYQMDLTKTLVDNLRFRTIYEFPTLHICSIASLSRFPILTDSDKQERLRKLVWDRNGQSQFWSLNQLIDHMEKVKPIRSPKNCQSAVEEGEIADEQQVELRKMVEEGRRLKLLARQSAKVAKQSVKEMKSNRKRPLSIIKHEDVNSSTKHRIQPTMVEAIDHEEVSGPIGKHFAVETPESRPESYHGRMDFFNLCGYSDSSDGE